MLISASACRQTDKKEFENTVLRTYSNPVYVRIGDAQILRAKDNPYNVYCTGGGSDGTACTVFYSGNLIDLVIAGNLSYRDPSTAWCTGSFWAPEL